MVPLRSALQQTFEPAAQSEDVDPEEAAEEAADAGDPTVGEQEKRGREADEGSSEERGDEGEVVHGAHRREGARGDG